MTLIKIRCYNCESDQFDSYDHENGFNLVRCSHCGLLYVNPRPALEEISAATQTGVHIGETVVNYSGTYNKTKIRKYLHVLSDFYPTNKFNLSGKKWLDIGCGYGELLEALKIFTKDGIVAKGSEPNEMKAHIAQNNCLDVMYIDLEKCNEKYDVISLLNVFSHLPNPVTFLNDLKKNLNPGGEILLETGDTCHLSVKYHHRPYYLPDHLSFANQKIVEQIFKRLGFKIIKVKKYTCNFHLKRLIKDILDLALFRRDCLRNLFLHNCRQDMFIRCIQIN